MELTYAEIKERVLSCVPKECPICGSSLLITQDLMHVMCGNPDCDGKLSRKLEIAAKALGIDNIGPAVAKELIDNLGVTHIYQIFDLTVNDFMKVPRYQDGMANNLYNSIHSLDGVPVKFSKFIRACQFKRVGEGSANDLAMAYKSLDDLLGADQDSLANVLGIVTKDVSEAIWGSIQDNSADARMLAKKVCIEYPKVSESSKNLGLICVVTGPLGFGSRPEFQELFGASYGIKWASAVSKNTDILVTNETTPTGKYKKALELQAAGGKIKILNEEEFLKYIGAEQTSTADVRVEATKMAVEGLQSFDGQSVEL